jgi:prepilin-type N-terminal cleavage/methylation domain-containing protein
MTCSAEAIRREKPVAHRGECSYDSKSLFTHPFMKQKPSNQSAFTLIELLVVISIIAILAGIALPVFGEVKIRGDQTKALSNAKQIGTACKLFAGDNNGIYPRNTDYPQGVAATPTPATQGDTSNRILRVLIPDYLPDRTIFAIQKSAFCKNPQQASANDPLPNGTNEWAYVSGLNDTSNARWPLLASGFDPATASSGAPAYVTDDSRPGGLWKGKRAIVIRCDTSGAVETLLSTNRTVRRADDDNQNAFTGDAQGNTVPGRIPWFSNDPAAAVFVHNPQQ